MNCLWDSPSNFYKLMYKYNYSAEWHSFGWLYITENELDIKVAEELLQFWIGEHEKNFHLELNSDTAQLNIW